MPDLLFYQNTFGGILLPKDDFDYWVNLANTRVVADMQQHVAKTDEQILSVQLCICAVAEVLYEEYLVAQNGGLISSEDVGAWNRTYDTSGHNYAKIASVENLYLAQTGLLYRGNVN